MESIGFSAQRKHHLVRDQEGSDGVKRGIKFTLLPNETHFGTYDGMGFESGPTRASEITSKHVQAGKRATHVLTKGLDSTKVP